MATSIEYGLIAGLIAVVIFGAVSTVQQPSATSPVAQPPSINSPAPTTPNTADSGSYNSGGMNGIQRSIDPDPGITVGEHIAINAKGCRVMIQKLAGHQATFEEISDPNRPGCS